MAQTRLLVTCPLPDAVIARATQEFGAMLSPDRMVDEKALIDALRSGHLAAAGLDVYRSEPDFDLRLKDLPNIFLTPHMGSATPETRTAMGMRALDNIAAALRLEQPIDQVAPTIGFSRT